MKHDPYSLTELIRNDDFIAWVMHPDALSDRRWQAFPGKAPGKETNRRVGQRVRDTAGERYRQGPAYQKPERPYVECGGKSDARICSESTENM
jgi:hypothetical protein